ncbi:MAG: leucine-rich repeat protein [Oscillospiraceae bacterium]|nr:leucine-rich repeat protein [Candidatus Limimonas egerieequi]
MAEIITVNGKIPIIDGKAIKPSGKWGEYGGIEFLSTGFEQVKLHVKQIEYTVVPTGWNCTKIDITECETMDYQGLRGQKKVVDLGNNNVLTNITTFTGQGNYFYDCLALKKIHLPNITRLAVMRNAFTNCTSLEDVLLGSVGHTIDSSYFYNTTFTNDTQPNLTITVYTTSEHVDALISAIRNSATNATIIIKASEDTTYGGETYLAGETILTSTPT